ncbi:MAG TPA: ABC transporter permease [Bryobacteraceae bacterium]|jgi:putative ABC transport system permease protein
MERLLQDIRFGVRLLAKRPGYGIIVVLSLALGIGAVTSVVSIVNAVLVRPYGPVNTDQWMYLWEHRTKSQSLNQISASMPNFQDWKRGSSSVFSDVIVWLPHTYTASGEGIANSEAVSAAVISPEVFRATGAVPAAGRLLEPADSASSDRRVVLSYGFWKRAYGQDPNLPGKTITLNGASHTVVGIAPPGFSFPPEARVDIWTAFPLAGMSVADRSMRAYRVAAKLAPGVNPKEAQSALDVIAARLAALHPEDHDYGVIAIPMREAVSGNFRAPLIALSGALGFALLLLSINIGYLRRVHLEARRKELALRMALGASRTVLIRQLFIETALLFGIGGGIGVLLAPVGVRLLLSFVPSSETPWLQVPIDGRVLLFSIVVTLLAAVVSGLLPVIGVSRSALFGRMVSNTAGVTSRLRAVVVASQVALALVPLCGAGLLIRSFARLLDVAPGFASEHRLTFAISAPRARYAGPKEVAAVAERLREAILEAPGVTQAALAQSVPFAPGARWLQALTRTDPKGITNFAQLPLVRYSVVTPGFFEALGIGLKAGRFITAVDTREGLPAVVINETLARHQFPLEDPIGKKIWINHAEALRETGPRTIVGVVHDIHMYGLDREPDPAAWVPIAQQDSAEEIWRNLWVVANSAINPADTVAGVRQRIHDVDSALTLAGVSSLDARVSGSLWRQRFSSALVFAFGLAALAIAVLGVFGVTSYLAVLRSHEFGVRMALGAKPADIARMVFRESLGQVAIGVIVGLSGAFALTRVLQGLLFGVTPTDPLTFAAVTGILVAAAMLACMAPASRAAKVDPIIAMRPE